MAIMDTLRAAFFEDLARLIDRWTAAGVEAVRDPDSRLIWTSDAPAFRRVAQAINETGRSVDFETVLRVLLTGLLDSSLAVIDGADKSAELGRVKLVTSDGESLGEGLHELFMGHLYDSGRR